MPASGKSTFSKKHFGANGYVIVNRDTLGTPAKCMKVSSLLFCYNEELHGIDHLLIVIYQHILVKAVRSLGNYVDMCS